MRQPVRTVLRAVGLVAVLALSACGSSAGTAGTSAATTTAPLPQGVSSRVLQLTDPSRVTDPTPAEAGGDATSGRSLPTTLYYPTDGPGPFPVVVFSHGLGAVPSGYQALLASWAAAGFVVAAPQFPLTSTGSALVEDDVLNQPADVSFVLTAVLALDATAGDDLAGRIDATHVAVAGHSAGAITTLGLRFDCCADPRITAAVVMAGEAIGFPEQFATPGVPILFLHGTADRTIPVANGEAVYAAAPGPKALVELTGGSHTEPYVNGGDDHFAVVRATTTDFLRWTLDGDAAALAQLRSDAAQPGISTLSGDALGG